MALLLSYLQDGRERAPSCAFEGFIKKSFIHLRLLLILWPPPSPAPSHILNPPYLTTPLNRAHHRLELIADFYVRYNKYNSSLRFWDRL